MTPSVRQPPRTLPRPRPPAQPAARPHPTRARPQPGRRTTATTTTSPPPSHPARARTPRGEGGAGGRLHLLCSPHRLVARTSRCGRDNPGSTPGVDTAPPRCVSLNGQDAASWPRQVVLTPDTQDLLFCACFIRILTASAFASARQLSRAFVRARLLSLALARFRSRSPAFARLRPLSPAFACLRPLLRAFVRPRPHSLAFV